MFQCAAGKDRTGLVAAMVLGLLGVDDDTITADYAASAAVVDALLARLHTLGLPRSRAAGTADHERGGGDDAARARLDAFGAHGSVEGYTRAHGLTEDEINTMRDALVERTRQER